jgi:hypothetical protein
MARAADLVAIDIAHKMAVAIRVGTAELIGIAGQLAGVDIAH